MALISNDRQNRQETVLEILTQPLPDPIKRRMIPYP